MHSNVSAVNELTELDCEHALLQVPRYDMLPGGDAPLSPLWDSYAALKSVVHPSSSMHARFKGTLL
jgi:hypothetical protein